MGPQWKMIFKPDNTKQSSEVIFSAKNGKTYPPPFLSMTFLLLGYLTGSMLISISMKNDFHKIY